MDRNDWNARYSGTELVWTAEPNRFLVAEVTGLPVGRALDLAAGEGRNSVWLAEQGWDVTAVDFSDAALAKARKLARTRSVPLKLVEADVTQYVPTPDSYDLVVIAYLHLPDPTRSQVIGRASQAVAAGGTLLIIGHDQTNRAQGYGGPQDPAVLATPEQIAAAIIGLDIERAEPVGRPVQTADGERVAIDQVIRAHRPGMISELQRSDVALRPANHSPTRVVIVGGVAGGMSTAARLRRLDADADIIVLERSGHVSFANCGLPYFVGGLIEEEEDLTLQTPEQLFDRFRLDVRVNDEVIAIDREAHGVTTRSTVRGQDSAVAYDKLVLSMGAAPIRPPIPGYDRVRTLRTVEDAARLASDVGIAPRTAVVIGAGFIGLEMAENLVGQGIDVTIVEATPQVLPPLDPELAVLVSDELVAHGIHVETGAGVASIEERTVTLVDGRVLAADLVVGAIGVRPDVGIAEQAGLELGPSGGIRVNEANQTNDPDIYAVGDAVEKADAISHATSLIALANVANRQGRRVADHIAGRSSHPVPSIGTAIVKVFDLVAATVGWNERRLRAAGRPFRAIHSHPYDHATYYPGATRMAAKLLFDPGDGTILGAQIVGRHGVDKRIDVIATAMATGISADRLADLELAYAPPFSSAKDPVNLLGYMAENVLSGDCDVVEPPEVEMLVAQGWEIVDVRTHAEHAAGAIAGSVNVPIDSLRDHIDAFRARPVLVYCEVGQRGHTATMLLHELGIQARNLDGGYQTWSAWVRAQNQIEATTAPTS
jgi:NADPH-dependent 2,4-dienoyl-CoA reductase/sulfur reductase-like enzyme/rhodanese-related sulfurtransferase